MRLNRRSVVIGLGTAAVGTGAAFGTGAFTQVKADRDATVTLVNDDDGYLTLDAQSDSNYVTDGDGTLGIDLSNVNRDSTLRVGEEHNGDPQSIAENVAFVIENNSEVPEINISAEASLGGTEVSDSDTELPFFIAEDEHNDGSGDQTGNLLDNEINNLEINGTAYVNVVVEASDAEEADIDTITFTATPS